MDRVLFRSEGQKLKEFIEIEEQQHGRHFLCISSKKNLLFCKIILGYMGQNILENG